MGRISTSPHIAGRHAVTHEPGGLDVVTGVVPGAHVLATTGPHTNTLPLTDIEVGVQGEIIHRGAADWEALAVGVAGQALLSGGPAADVSWGAPAPAAHAASHADGAADEIDVADLAGTGGDAGDIIESDGDALSYVDPDGRYAPAAHEATHVFGGADDIDAPLDARALAMTTQGDMVFLTGVANVTARLAAGTAGQRLVTGGAGANPGYTWDVMLDPVPDADHTGNGLITVDTVGENVDAGEVLFMQNDGKYWKADADAVGTMPGKVLAMEDILADAAGRLLHEGYYRDESWTWSLGAGEANLLFVHTVAGDLVQFANKPAGSGDQVQVVGYVVTAKIIYFDPSYEMVEIA